MISVVVPVYNVEKYLDRCVESILNQSFRDFELILVDDGSPDNCPDMCDAWAEKDSRIKVIHKLNGGLSDARNKGIDASSGEYLTFVDSDDWVEPEFLGALYNGIIDNDADVAQCNYVQVFADRRVSFLYEPKVYERDYIEYQLLDAMSEGKMDIMSFSRWNKIYKSELLKSSIDMCDASVSLGEDFLMNFAVFGKCSRIAVLDTPPLYNYWFNTQSITGSYNPKVKYGLDSFHNNLMAIAKRHNCYKGDIYKTKQIGYLKHLYLCMVSSLSLQDKKSEVKEYMAFIDRKNMLKYGADFKSVIMQLTFLLLYMRLYALADLFLIVLKIIRFIK